MWFELVFIFVVFALSSEVSLTNFSFQGASNRLTSHLLDKHDRCAPPDGLVTVAHDIELVHIVAVNELKQNMRVSVYIAQQWYDRTLSWKPEDFEGTMVTWLPESSIWVPDIIVFNTLEHKELLHAVRSPIAVHYDGRVVFSYPALYTVLCSIGIAKFPFDDHTCNLRFASWAYSEDKVLLNASHKPALQKYSPNEEWALQDVDMVREEYEHEDTVVSEIVYNIKVARKPFYYLVSLVVPSYIICVLSIAGLFARFSTRHERQERFTLGVTAILSMAVLSLVVTEKVPHSSENVPLLIVYFHFIIIMVTIATILTSTVMRVHAKGFEHKLQPPPPWMAKLLFIKEKFAKFEKKKNKVILQVHSTAEQWGEISRRMDYLLATLFVLIISAPTNGLASARAYHRVIDCHRITLFFFFLLILVFLIGFYGTYDGMSSVGAVASDHFRDFRGQLTSNNQATTLKRTQEDSSLDCGIPAKRGIMHGMDAANAMHMGTMGNTFNVPMSDNVVEVIQIPENTVGLVIGRKGSEIQNIQAKSGCRVQMSPEADNPGGVRQCTLQGPKMAVEHAKQLINDVVTRAAQRQAGMPVQQPQFTGDTSRHISVDMLIPATKCGLIIGKQGDTIKQLQEQAGCKMMMIQDSQEVTGQAKPLRLTGDPDKVEIGKRLVTEMLLKDEQGGGGISNRFHHDGTTAKGEVVVPRSSVGMIIGKGGEMIKRLANETGTKIQFKPDDDPSSPERCAIIMGTREQIYKATELITELVNKSMANAVGTGGAPANCPPNAQQVFYMHVPANKTGLVIGKGGETIRQINAESGAHCELSAEPAKNTHEKVFIIKGTPYQIHHAQHIIRIKVGDVQPNTPVPPFQQAGAANGAFPVAPQYAAPYTAQPVQGGQWNAVPAEGGWNSGGVFYGNPAGATHAAPYANAQYQQPQTVAHAHAQPAAGVQINSQPAINPQTGQPDYSAQWAEYYRSVGLHEQAAMVENQMKQTAARGGAATTAGYAAPGTAPATAQYAYGQGQPGFPAANQYQAPQ
ncbi:unnamed protein product [Caenorhabditis auriculariae]|uniref:K Homology domain-containing protein n=1 Tax=Caenorhabditis auriculariae TaxID=2777116 RepID=A0A8S1H1L5_9PELO|nr:unnamed protein product [Caenorhabditis auriculariae]